MAASGDSSTVGRIFHLCSGLEAPPIEALKATVRRAFADHGLSIPRALTLRANRTQCWCASLLGWRRQRNGRRWRHCLCISTTWPTGSRLRMPRFAIGSGNVADACPRSATICRRSSAITYCSAILVPRRHEALTTRATSRPSRRPIQPGRSAVPPIRRPTGLGCCRGVHITDSRSLIAQAWLHGYSTTSCIQASGAECPSTLSCPLHETCLAMRT